MPSNAMRAADAAVVLASGDAGSSSSGDGLKAWQWVLVGLAIAIVLGLLIFIFNWFRNRPLRGDNRREVVQAVELSRSQPKDDIDTHPIVQPSTSRHLSRQGNLSAMESRLSSSSMKNMKISMESERMFADIEDEMQAQSPREMRRSSSRIMSPSNSSTSVSNGGNRVSVKDQLYTLECKVQSHEDTIQKLMSIHQADKALLLTKIEEITDRTSDELHKLRVDYQKKLNTASEEIERLNKCLNVQRGHITTLQEQCQSLHKHVVQVDDDVTKLATEVLGE
ncbi:hypothetical protein BBO99_00005545 [Phytophthora kernoviae]|uniref:Uncharacterized protein n=2 Tax=Phytophthora kernoviae TaxID=325452 RepID=A0A421GNC1_9STRA|nr:hypothetical protein G195_009847 [Phytophthora kernoviae 00238/432]KAG2526828.1 hypothetical protein JM16_003669 [Phytophthora kernoviae]KAG2527073.1 hypothetical protein JM18_003177 [Phytophthora kernoviae]RLN27143.1 hypothetical protein BBI17_003762 [Phytophthora kernoviae]RLN79046.1 hypothetical protein BBO99_00005545 [Phytophthora kernoviae]